MGKIAQCSTPDVLAKEEELATYGNLEAAASAVVGFLVTNPSVRLHMVISLFVRPITGWSIDEHVYTGETWQLWAQTDGAPNQDLNFVFNDGASPPASVPQNLPDSYEAQSGIKVIRGEANLFASTGARGTAIVRVTWEAADPSMTEDERARLFALCDVARVPAGNFPELA